MDTTLKGIRFPKNVVEILDSYARDRFGMTFSKYMVHLAVQKCSEIVEKDFKGLDDEMVKHYYDLKKLQEEMLKKDVRKPLNNSFTHSLLDSLPSRN